MYLTQLYTNSLSNQNISSAVLVGTYTNTTRERLVFVNVWAAQIAGNGNYVVYAKVQRAGAGTAYEWGARTTVAVPSGVTEQAFPSIALKLGATDVLTCFIIGLVGDTTTPDLIMEVDEQFVNVDASGNPTPNDSSGITTLLARIVGTLLTGNHNPQTGDAYARVGAAGAGLTALGDTRIANLDATVSSRAAAAALTTLQGNVTTILADYARRTGDYLTSAALPTNFALFAIDGSGRITLAPSQIVVKKNTALANFMFTMIDDTTGDPAAGLTVTATRSLDGAAFGACANAVTEVSGGWYKITLAAADLNGTVIAIRMTATTAKDRDFTIVTQP